MILFINIKHNVVSVIDKKNFSLVVAEPEMHVLSTNIKDNFEHSTNLSCVLIGIKDTLQYFRLRPITTFFVSSKAQDYIKKIGCQHQRHFIFRESNVSLFCNLSEKLRYALLITSKTIGGSREKGAAALYSNKLIQKEN